jgi:hypothetical protein
MQKLFVAIAAAVALALSASPASAEQGMFFGALVTSETTREVDAANDGFGLGDYIELSPTSPSAPPTKAWGVRDS